MLMVAAILDSQASLVLPLRGVLGNLRAREVCRWQPRTGVTPELLQGQKSVTQKQYHGALSNHHQWTSRGGASIRLMADLD